jgi:hypothetical protein
MPRHPPVTSLTIALFDARYAGHACESGRVGRLKRSLNDLGIDANVMTFDSVATDLDVSGFDAFFLRGVQSSDTPDLSLQAADDALRAALHKAEIGYQVIYGSDEELLQQMTQLIQVMRAIGNPVTARPIAAAVSNQKPASTDRTAPWVWLCDKCSDPQCEHRLLTDLLEQRQTRLTR